MKLKLSFYLENDKRDSTGAAVAGWRFWERAFKLQEIGPENLTAVKQMLEDMLREAWESES